MTESKRILEGMGACREAIAWCDGLSPEGAWGECPRGDWLLWVAIEAGVAHSLIVRAACACAQEGLVHVPRGEDQPRKTIEVAGRWTEGRAGLVEVRAAITTTYADGYDAAGRGAAYAAAYAAHAAGYAVSYAAYATTYAAGAAAAAADAYAYADDAAYGAYAAHDAGKAADAYAASAIGRGAHVGGVAASAAAAASLASSAEIVRGIIPFSAIADRLRSAD